VYPRGGPSIERARRFADGRMRGTLEQATAEIADAALVGYPDTITVSATTGESTICPTMPDMSQYVRKDSIPCWGCNLK